MDTAAPLQLLIVEDHAMVRAGLVQLLHTRRPAIQVAEATGLDEALARLRTRPGTGLVLLDVHLPGHAPLQALRALRIAWPLLPVLLMSGDDDPLLAARALEEGASGWVPKSADPETLLAAIALVQSGGCYLPPFLRQPRAEAPERLTDRQLDVLQALVRGRSNKEIARELGMAEPTVKGHLVTIFRVLKVRNRSEAVLAGQAPLRAAGRGLG
jgi:DNA-binding NarL/FixJ family response regulator